MHLQDLADALLRRNAVAVAEVGQRQLTLLHRNLVTALAHQTVEGTANGTEDGEKGEC